MALPVKVEGKPPKLDQAVVELADLRNDAEREILRAVELTGTQAVFVVEASLLPILELLVADFPTALKSEGLMEGGLRTLSRDGISLPPACNGVAFLIRPTIASADLVVEQVRRWDELRLRVHTCVFFLPAQTPLCRTVFDEAPVRELIHVVEDLNIFWVPLDNDLLSMELEDAYRDVFLHGDSTTLDHVGLALDQLQSCFGRIPDVKVKGAAALRVLRLLKRKREEASDLDDEAARTAAAGQGGTMTPRDTPALPSGARRGGPSGGAGSGPAGGGPAAKAVSGGEIDVLILLDRGVDSFTPLVSPLSFEALVDDLVGLAHGQFEREDDVEATVAPAPGAKGATGAGAGAAAAVGAKQMVRMRIRTFLNGNDRVFSDIRDQNIASVGALLVRKSREIESLESRRHTLNEVSEIKKFVKEIPGLQEDKESLARLVDLTKIIQDTTNEPDFREQWLFERNMMEGEKEKEIDDYIERGIAQHWSLSRLLRLMCMRSLTGGGLKRFDEWRQGVLHAHGFEHIFTFANLESLGLLTRRESTGLLSVFSLGSSSSSSTSSASSAGAAAGAGGVGGVGVGPGGAWSAGLGFIPGLPMDAGSGTWNWTAARRSLSLIRADVNTTTPDDVSYVTAGYAPILARVVELALTGLAAAPAGGSCEAWGRGGEVLRCLPGPAIEVEQLVGGEYFRRVSPGGKPSGAVSAGAGAGGGAGGGGSGGGGGGGDASGAEDGADHGRESDEEDSDGAEGARTTKPKRRRRRRVLVFVLGGISMLEVAALRYLTEHLPFDVIAASTHITNGHKMVQAAQEDVRNGFLEDEPDEPEEKAGSAGGSGAAPRTPTRKP